MSRRVLRSLCPAAALAVALGGGGLAALETDTVGSFADGVWWALSLVTTVGFVGHTPVTAAGKLIAGLLMVFGFALLSLTTAAIASLFVREDGRAVRQRDGAFERQALAELRALHERLQEIEDDRPARRPSAPVGC